MGYAAHFPDRALTWVEGEGDERRFRLILLGMLTLFLAGSIVVPLIPASRPELDQARELPPRLARLLVREPPKTRPEAPKPVELPPEPVPEPVPEPEPAPQPEPAAAPEPAPRPEPRPEPPPQSRSEAREKARRTGLIALSDQLAELRHNEAADRLVQPRRLIRAAPRPEPAGDGDPAAVTDDIVAGSGGIDEETLSRETGDVALAEREVTRVENPEIETAARAAVERHRAAGQTESPRTPRSIEEIQPVFDRNKGALDVLYRRALRRNPALAGKVVLRLTIAPSGAVTACEIVSSELGAPALEKKLVARVRMFDFGARADAVETTTTYPIDFFPFFPG